MIRNVILSLVTVCTGLAFNAALAGQFVVELDTPLNLKSDSLATHGELTLDESFAAGQDSYAIFSAPNLDSLNQFLQMKGIQSEKISEVLFINSPVVGGGKAAGENPLEGHKVYVIERPIPGVGFFGLEKKKKISKGSNAAIAKLGNVIEWDHSYLTSEGTYCVYRADSPETLREHGALAGAPIGKITPVEHVKH